MNEADVLDRMIEQSQRAIDDLHLKVQLEERYLAELIARRRELAPEGHRAPSSHPAANGARRHRATARIHAGGVPSHILSILEAAGHELGVDDIARELESRGVTTGQEDGMRGLINSAVVRRPDLFERVGEAVIDLRSRPRPGKRAGRR